MGLVSPAALSLDVPALGLRAREGEGEAAGAGFFDLLAGHLATTGASEKAISVISAKAEAAAALEPAEAEGDGGAAEGDASAVDSGTVPGVVAPVDLLPAPPDSEAAAADQGDSLNATVGELPAVEVPEPAASDGAIEVLPEAAPPEAPTAEPAVLPSLVEEPGAAINAQTDAVDGQQIDAPGPEGLLEAPPEPPPDEPSAEVERVVRSVGNATQAPEEDVAAPTASLPSAELVEADVPETTADTVQVAQSAETAALSESAPTDAPGTSDLEAPVQPAPAEQVADVIVERLEGDGGEARLMLDPPDLGEVVIRLHTRAEQVRVEVVVERPEALQLLRDGSPSLQALLAQRGLNLGDAAFFLAHQQGGGDSPFGGEPRQEGQDGFATLLGLDEPGDSPAIQKLQRLRAAYNPDGALLYRV